MYDPSKILTRLEEKVQMRQSRRKTLAAIVGGAMRLQGVGVLALGRSMGGPAKAKHRIKRVDRFLANPQVELDALSEALFHQLRPATGGVVVLADWTARHDFQHLVLALPREQLPEELHAEVGQQLQLTLESGQPIVVNVTDVSESSVTLDANHPLTGQDLTFDLQLLEIL